MNDLFDTDFLFNADCFPLFPENPDLLPLITENPVDMFPSHPDTLSLNSQLERLNLDVHTQSLRVVVEKAKRQKLRTKLRRIKKELIPKNKFISNDCASINQLQEIMVTLRHLYETHLGTVSYGCFFRANLPHLFILRGSY